MVTRLCSHHHYLTSETLNYWCPVGPSIYLFIFLKILFILMSELFFFPTVLGLHCCVRAFLVEASGGYSSLPCAGFSLRWLLLLRSMALGATGFSSCGSRAQELWRTGLVAPQHVGSSWTRDWTCVPCIGRWILNHCATREAPHLFNVDLSHKLNLFRDKFILSKTF